MKVCLEHNCSDMSHTHIFTLCVLLPVTPTLLTAFIQVPLKYLVFTHARARTHTHVFIVTSIISSRYSRNNQLVGDGVSNNCSNRWKEI